MHSLITDEMIRRNSKFNFYIDCRFSSSLFVMCCGHADCRAENISTLENCFPYYSLHICVKGSGLLIINGVEHAITKGDIFLFPQDTPTMCYTKITDLWEIFWINFSGTDADKFSKRMGLSIEHPVIKNIPTKLYEKLILSYVTLIQAHSQHTKPDLLSMSTLYEIASIISEYNEIDLAPIKNDKSTYVTKALIYIENNYTKKDFSINEVAGYLGIHANYFSKIFHLQTGLCFMKFLRHFRIQKAMEIIDNGSHLIKEISDFVGYSDPLYFSRDFKKIMTFSPKHYTSIHLAPK